MRQPQHRVAHIVIVRAHRRARPGDDILRRVTVQSPDPYIAGRILVQATMSISDKTAIFDEEMAAKYDMSIDMDIHNNTSCYVFTQKVKPEHRDGVVIDEMRPLVPTLEDVFVALTERRQRELKDAG